MYSKWLNSSIWSIDETFTGTIIIPGQSGPGSNSSEGGVLFKWICDILKHYSSVNTSSKKYGLFCTSLHHYKQNRPYIYKKFTHLNKITHITVEQFISLTELLCLMWDPYIWIKVNELLMIDWSQNIRSCNLGQTTRPSDSQQKEKKNLLNSGLCRSGWPQGKTEGKRKER